MARNMTKEENQIRLQRQIEFAKQQLKVKDLIRFLKRFDPDLPVVYMGEFVCGAILREEFPLGDDGNPYGCSYCKVVELV